MNQPPAIVFREKVKPSDPEAVRLLVQSSGFFSQVEVEIALELVEEHLMKGEESGYSFLFAELQGQVVAYSCFGPIPGTESNYDLYWIAVLNDFRSMGIGKEVLQRSEQIIAQRGGRQIYVETSSRDQYEPTRSFYKNHGYGKAAQLQDFYAVGDHKVIYVKAL